MDDITSKLSRANQPSTGTLVVEVGVVFLGNDPAKCCIPASALQLKFQHNHFSVVGRLCIYIGSNGKDGSRTLG